MKVRIKFRKYGVMKFVGHLDLMRYFQKAMRRAGLPVAFTSGFSPHMIMSFAQPLGIGFTSEGEYLDVELLTPISSNGAVKRLNAVMVEGVDVVSLVEIPQEKKRGAMRVTAAADYMATVKRGIFPRELWEAVSGFMEKPEIIVLQKTKRSEKQTDIKPMIYEISKKEEGLFLCLSTGGERNLKPELVMEALCGYASFNASEIPFHYHRLEIYGHMENGKGLLPLEKLGERVC